MNANTDANVPSETGKFNRGSNSNNNPNSSDEILKSFRLAAEKYSVSKDTMEQKVSIEKRWITSTRKIEIPIKYEQIFINGKTLDEADKSSLINALVSLKNKISYKISKRKRNDENTIKMKYMDIENKTATTDNPSEYPSNDKLEGTITLWGEELVINKKMVKIAEFALKKQKVTSTETLDVDLRSEKLTIKYPGRATEEII
jgi:stress response protein YsnF